MPKPTDQLKEHNYDGILEFDNPLPRWWVYLFLLTIIWGVVYIFYYHFASIGDSSDKEYAKEMQIFNESMSTKNSGLSNMTLTKDDLVVLNDDANLKSGKSIFQKNCVSCHGNSGEGGVGPNLTDDYWIHGGKYENIATTIMNGVPEKGMITWKTVLKKDEILKVASYVVSLRGTNPPNPKAPQGTLITSEN